MCNDCLLKNNKKKDKMAVSDNKKQKTNIMSSINVLFYVSFCVGIVPFSFNEYRKNRIIQFSVFGIGYCIFTLIYNFLQYHFAISNFLISSNSDDGSGNWFLYTTYLLIYY